MLFGFRHTRRTLHTPVDLCCECSGRPAVCVLPRAGPTPLSLSLTGPSSRPPNRSDDRPTPVLPLSPNAPACPWTTSPRPIAQPSLSSIAPLRPPSSTSQLQRPSPALARASSSAAARARPRAMCSAARASHWWLLQSIGQIPTVYQPTPASWPTMPLRAF